MARSRKSSRRETIEEDPERLADLLVSVRKDFFGISSQEAMANLLNRCVRYVRGKPTTVFSRDVVGSLERRDVPIKYIQLEAYANAMQMPTGVLLLISRFQGDDHYPEQSRVISQMYEFMVRDVETNGLQGIAIAKRLMGVSPYEEREMPKDSSGPSQIERLRLIKERHALTGFDPLADLGLWNGKLLD